MQLKINEYPVSSVEWGKATEYKGGRLTVCRENVLSLLESAGDLKDVDIVEMELVSPHTPSRVVNVFDVIPAHSRLGEGVFNYPGFLDAVQTVGHGSSAALSGFSVLAISSLPSRHNKILDKSGVGAELTPHAGHFHLALRAEPKRQDMSKGEYYRRLKKIGLRVGSYLAKAAASTEPANTVAYALDSCPPGLPRVAYVCMLASHQSSEKGEAILYGDDLSGMLPTVLHPNELLDGAVISPDFNLGVDTYTFQNNPVIKGLYQRHGKELDFAGVVAYAAHVTRERRERSVQMAVNLVSNILKADLALITKVGGGIPESDVMQIIENLEQRGVRTCAIIWSHLGDGTIRDLLTAYSPAADALVSVGINDAWVTLSEQAKVVGGGPLIGPFSDDPADKPQPSNSALRVRFRDISGAISQLGASRVALVEI
ncbi:MAG: glycine/sarcosine/betaine reductase component B subunit [Peptococcaceae bacterium]|jgi:glycine reductase|nr:glycine/sarcosine/betaine reductase component B subunit [Peptococcaceae bacterium]MDH7525755.1 glycine/sarcosine/betaine reductase component B subunit [Peptococcaceae bacterium]